MGRLRSSHARSGRAGQVRRLRIDADGLKQTPACCEVPWLIDRDAWQSGRHRTRITRFVRPADHTSWTTTRKSAASSPRQRCSGWAAAILMPLGRPLSPRGEQSHSNPVPDACSDSVTGGHVLTRSVLVATEQPFISRPAVGGIPLRADDASSDRRLRGCAPSDHASGVRTRQPFTLHALRAGLYSINFVVG